MDVAHRPAPPVDRGAVIRDYRLRARLRQRDVAAKLGCSISTLSRLETGGAQHADVDTLLRLAQLLSIPLDEFGLGDPFPRSPAGILVPIQRGADMRRRTLLAGMIGVGAARPIGAVAPDLAAAVLAPTGDLPDAETMTQLRRVRTAFIAGKYGDAARLLPPVIATASRSVRLRPVLVHAYALASEIATKTNDNDLASVAADRAFSTAHRSGDPKLVAVAAQRVAIALRRDGQPAQALTLLTRSADDLAAVGSARALRGHLLLTGSYTAAVAGDDAAATAMLADAELLAGHVPATLRFSTAIVSGYAVSICTMLGDTARAVESIARIQPGELPTPERQARTAVDAAHAWDMHGHSARAVSAFLAAERAAPEELKRASVRRRLVSMLDRPGSQPTGLRDLAVRAGALA